MKKENKMSTKIYYAYRLRSTSGATILGKLQDAKKMALDVVRSDGDFLKMLHVQALSMAHKDLEEGSKTEKQWAERFVRDTEKGEFEDFYFGKSVERAANNPYRFLVSLDLRVSVFFRGPFTYLKFFPNNKVERDIVDNVVCTLNAEDYHYQNQTDPPEDVPYSQYQYRDKVWDELTKSTGGNYRGGFQFIIIDHFDLTQDLSRACWNREKDSKELYPGYAYQFDGLKKKEDANKTDVS